MILKNQVAVMTGAGSGFGQAIAELFAAEGARVVLADIDATKGEHVAGALRAQGHDALFFETDVGTSASVKALVEATLQAFGRIDILVNNAGVSHAAKPMFEVTEAAFDHVFRVNVKSIYLTALHVVPVLRQQKSGTIINIASAAANRPRPGLVWYCGSKGAVVTITRAMALELAADKIRVNAINPTMGATGLLSTFMGQEDTPANREPFIKGIPLGRFVEPRDVANAALFLAGSSSEFLTGVCLDVDGGRSV